MRTIRLIKILFIICIIQSSSLIAQEINTEKFSQGVTSFSSGDFQKALELWLEIYDTGFRSAPLNYNIGNAYFKLNNTPKAILFYERAYLLAPADEEINYNLQIARTLAVDRFQEIPELFFVRWFNFISLIFHTNSWAIFSIVTFILFLLFLAAYFYSSRYRVKVAGFWIALVFFVLSASSFSFALRNKSLVYNSGKAIITVPVVSGKSSPDSSGNDLFVLHEGTCIKVEDKVGEWAEVRLSDGNTGWIPLNSLEVI